MPRKTIQNFSITQLSILNTRGEVDPKLEPKISPQQLKRMYENMLRTREFDRRATQLQRQGRLGTFAASTGQEAISVGSATAMEAKDWAVPCFREQGVYLTRGIPAKILYLFYMGTEEGNRIPKSLHTLPFCVPCATQILHGVGIGMAAKIQKDPVGVITYFGDGASSEGDFHEALNFASVYQLPVVFFCQNNQWAISTPPTLQSHSASFAQKALAYGMEGVQVDGNDILAVYQATSESLNRAKTGQGPTLIEGLTYRMDPHTTSDDPSRYRRIEDVEVWKNKDPIQRFEKYLLSRGILHPGDSERMQVVIEKSLKEEAKAAEAICERLSPDEIFSYLYQNLPEVLKGQRDEALHSHPGEEEVVHA